MTALLGALLDVALWLVDRLPGSDDPWATVRLDLDAEDMP